MQNGAKGHVSTGYAFPLRWVQLSLPDCPYSHGSELAYGRHHMQSYQMKRCS